MLFLESQTELLSAVSAPMQALGFIWRIKHRVKKAEMCSTGSRLFVFLFGNKTPAGTPDRPDGCLLRTVFCRLVHHAVAQAMRKPVAALRSQVYRGQLVTPLHARSAVWVLVRVR